MEDKLDRLVRAGNKENRIKWASEWQQQGGKVVGVLDSLVPDEVIYAAGMLPWRIQGTWTADVSKAMVYRLPHGSSFLHHVMESLLEGELDFLDGMVCSDRDEDFLRFADYWEHIGRVPLIRIVEVPVIDSELTRRRFTGEIRAFTHAIEEFGGTEVPDQSLREAIGLYNKSYELLKAAYDLRKRAEPPLSGGEALTMTTAAMVMPRGEFNSALEELLPYLASRKARTDRSEPRVLLSGDLLDNPAYVDLVEQAGCLVAMDDLDTGSRYFWEVTDSAVKDPSFALASRYLQNRSPRMFDWRGQGARVVEMVRDFDIDGVIDLPDMYDYTRGFRRPYMEHWLKEAGVPAMSFERSYHLDNTGQLKTKIEAFLEILSNE